MRERERVADRWTACSRHSMQGRVGSDSGEEERQDAHRFISSHFVSWQKSGCLISLTRATTDRQITSEWGGLSWCTAARNVTGLKSGLQLNDQPMAVTTFYLENTSEPKKVALINELTDAWWSNLSIAVPYRTLLSQVLHRRLSFAKHTEAVAFFQCSNPNGKECRFVRLHRVWSYWSWMTWEHFIHSAHLLSQSCISLVFLSNTDIYAGVKRKFLSSIT